MFFDAAFLDHPGILDAVSSPRLSLEPCLAYGLSRPLTNSIGAVFDPIEGIVDLVARRYHAIRGSDTEPALPRLHAID